MSLESLAHPIVWAGALAAAAAAELVRRRRAPAPALPIAFPRLIADLPCSLRQRARRWLPAARLGLLAVLGLAAAGPILSWQVVAETRRGVDLLIALDASSSMTTVLPGAFAGTRFDAARNAALEFARRRPGDRVALTAFARYPRQVVPLTWDHDLLAALLLDAAPVEAGSEEDRTAIGVALADGADRLRGAGDRGRLLVLVTDGANNLGPIAPEEGVQLCRDAGVRVHSIAIGGDARFGSGSEPPNLGLLEQIAAATGGRAFSAQDQAALEDACRAIDDLEPAAFTFTSGLRAWPLASPLLAAGLIAWIALALAERTLVRSLP